MDRLCTTFEMFAFGPAELLQIEIEHGSQPIDELRAQKRVGYMLSKVMKHVDRFTGKRQIRLAHSFICSQLA